MPPHKNTPLFRHTQIMTLPFLNQKEEDPASLPYVRDGVDEENKIAMKPSSRHLCIAGLAIAVVFAALCALISSSLGNKQQRSQNPYGASYKRGYFSYNFPLALEEIEELENRPALTGLPDVTIELDEFSPGTSGENLNVTDDHGSYIIGTKFTLNSDQRKFPTYRVHELDATSLSQSANSTDGYVPDHLPVDFTPEGYYEEGHSRDLTVFGGDDRRPFVDASYPWGTVGRVWNSHQRGPCTGTMVGRRLMLTASHCIDWSSKNQWLRFDPAYNDGVQPYGVAYAQDVFALKEITWGSLSAEDSAFDWAVVLLDRPIGDLTGWVGFEGGWSTAWTGLPTWDNIGYPCPAPYYGVVPVLSRAGSIDAVDVHRQGNFQAHLFYTKIDVQVCHSGGPIWALFPDSEFPKTIGVVSAESSLYNYAGGGPALGNMILSLQRQYP